MNGLAQVNLVVSDLDRATRFWEVLGWPSTPRHGVAAVVQFDSGMVLVLYEPSSARRWDPGWHRIDSGTTVIDVNLPSRDAVDDAYLRLMADGFDDSVAPCDTFFGARYAIVRDNDGHRVGLKSPLDPDPASPSP